MDDLDRLYARENYSPDSLFVLPSDKQDKSSVFDELRALDELYAKNKFTLPSDQAERQAQQTPQSWTDVAAQAAGNILPSAGQFASDIAQPVLHPIQTVQILGDVGMGILEKVGLKPGSEH